MNQKSHETTTSFDSAWNYGDPAGTERAFREILAKLEGAKLEGAKLEGAPVKGITLETAMPENEAAAREALQLQTQIARALGLQRKFSDGFALLDSIAQASTGDPLVRVRWLLEKGRILNSSGSPKESIPIFEQAFQIAEAFTLDFYTVDAAHMLGIVCESEAALSWNEKAVEIAEASTDERAKGWLGALYNNIGWTYSGMGRHEIALEYFTRDLAWYEERGRSEQVRIARWSIAKMHRLRGNLSEAFRQQQMIARGMDAEGREPSGYVYEELGECALRLNLMAQEVASYFRRAGELLGQDPWLSANESKRIERLNHLGSEANVDQERHKSKKVQPR